MSSSESLKGSQSRVAGPAFYCLRAYIDIAQFMLPSLTQSSSLDFISDASSRLDEMTRGLSLPMVWRSGDEEVKLMNEVSPYYEAFYSESAVDTYLTATRRLMSSIEPRQLEENHLVALVLYRVKSLHQQDRPCSISNWPYAIAINPPLCTKYKLYSLTSFANKMRTSGASNSVWKKQPSPPPTTTVARKRPYAPMPLVKLTPLVRPPPSEPRPPSPPVIRLAPEVVPHSVRVPHLPPSIASSSLLRYAPSKPIPRPPFEAVPASTISRIVSHTRRLRTTRPHPVRHQELLSVAMYICKHGWEWTRNDPRVEALRRKSFYKSNPSRSPRAWKRIIKRKEKPIERIVQILRAHEE